MADGPLILLVDDYEDALEIYNDYLTYRGYRVIVARDGQEAVDAARAHRPDLILLDLRMPVLSGLEVIRILRRDPAFDACPVVALTAHALEGERIEALRAGFDDVIAKPCLPDQLADTVERILHSKDAPPLVLVATDLDDHARAYTTALSAAGYRVELARTGEAVISIVRRTRPACALIDLRLPDRSGWDVCRELKSQPENALIRIIVLTHELTEDAAAGSVKVGCHAWLMQPTVADDVVEAVREVLGSRADRPASPGEAVIGPVSCPACDSPEVRAGVRIAAVQYFCCLACRLCWRVEAATAV